VRANTIICFRSHKQDEPIELMASADSLYGSYSDPYTDAHVLLDEVLSTLEVPLPPEEEEKLLSAQTHNQADDSLHLSSCLEQEPFTVYAHEEDPDIPAATMPECTALAEIAHEHCTVRRNILYDGDTSEGSSSFSSSSSKASCYSVPSRSSSTNAIPVWSQSSAYREEPLHATLTFQPKVLGACKAVPIPHTSDYNNTI